MKSNKPVTVKICFYLELKVGKNHPKLIKYFGRSKTSPRGDFTGNYAYFRLVSEIADLFMAREAMFNVTSRCPGQVCALSQNKQQQTLQTVSGRS